MEHNQPLSEICIKTVFQLSAEGDFRNKVEDVSLCVHGLACKLHVYFGLARSCHSMQKHRHSTAETFLYALVCFVLSLSQFEAFLLLWTALRVVGQ